jgi:transcriptional regulator with XRE-family HTH domain
MSAVEASAGLGEWLRHWRRVRGKSQLDLAGDARTTARYVSFLETGRAQPSRRMVRSTARSSSASPPR